jgi:CDP-6-deoxy-D-xylo-4-hexulose-3-dehydrase
LPQALSSKTKAIFIAHTLGNPFDAAAVQAFAKKHDLWLLEDCCDAVGSTFNNQHVGTFGSMATVSFYPAHHMTMGEGGCVLTNNAQLRTIVESFRDWGRDCWCIPGVQNTCGKRFGWQLGDLPMGYDHKYIYSHLGYNMKPTDIQAAIGVAQLDKLPAFIETRRRNFKHLHDGLSGLSEWLILPEATPGANPSWFGFPISVRTSAPFNRTDLVVELQNRMIQTRNIFAGNLARQPAYKDVNYRQIGELANTDAIMNDSFWIGVYPGISQQMTDYMIENITDAVKHLKRSK